MLAAIAMLVCVSAGIFDWHAGREPMLFEVAFVAIAGIFSVLGSCMIFGGAISRLADASQPLVEVMRQLVGAVLPWQLDTSDLPDRDPVRTYVLPPPLAPSFNSLV